MARTSLVVTLDLAGRDPANLADKNTKSGREALLKAKKELDAVLSGAKQVGLVNMNFDGAQPIAASGTVTLATALAADTVTINGVALTAVSGAPAANQFDISGTDTADATSLAAAINLSTNDSGITKQVEASNFAATITLATCTAGSGVRIAGYEFIGYSVVPSNPANDGAFSISGTDTQDAAALVAAINAHPKLGHLVVASNSSGVVTVRQRRGTTSIGRCEVIALPSLGVASGITVGSSALSVAFAATAVVLVSSKCEGVFGNACTLASSNGSRLAVSAARLAGGTGGDGTRVLFAQGSVN